MALRGRSSRADVNAKVKATFEDISYDVPTRLETTSKSCLQPITGPIVIEGYTGVGMDVVGAGCEDRRKYQ